MRKTRKPNKKIVRAAIRGSVPDGKLKKARILLSDAPYGATAITGFTEYGNDRETVVKIAAPEMDNAAGITVRGHETRHATRHRKTRKKNLTMKEAQAFQIVDDVNVETGTLPYIEGEGIEAYRRAHLTTAMRDLAVMLRDKRRFESGFPETWEDRNRRLLAAMRIKAMLRHYREGSKNPRTIRQAIAASRKLRDMIGYDTSKALHTIINLAQHQKYRSRAISLLAMLLEDMPVHDMEEGDEENERGGLLAPVTEGTAIEGKMEIKDLRPKSVFTAKERQVSQRYSPDGVHLNVARYVNAIVSGDSHGLFARRVRQKAGGTVVIDASGSMSANRFNLTALARVVPTATLAYYSGHDNGTGVLSVYADKGKRYNGELPYNTLLGGNAVDLPAVRWMMSQPKPWTFVSDLEFTGGTLGSEIIAKSLLERAQERGEVTIYESLDAAYEAFSKGGDLGEAEAKLRTEKGHDAAEIDDALSRRRSAKARAARSPAGLAKARKAAKM